MVVRGRRLFSGRDIYFNVIRTPGNATNPQDWTNAEIQGRRDAWTMFELWKEALPEFKDAYFFTSGPTAGARESRRIVGDYMLTGDDIRTAKRQDDVVVLGGVEDRPASQGHSRVSRSADRTAVRYFVQNVAATGRRESLGCGSLSLGNFRGSGIKSSHS